jgi:hypothetical protein
MIKGQKIWKEFVQDNKNIDLSSLKPKDTLNPKFWKDENTLKDGILEQLMQIAKDFYENLGLDGDLIKDITITGSSASYNWSKYSDIDLHILLDFKKVNKDVELVEEFFRGKTFVWNHKHNITISSHEVEIYVQNIKEIHHSGGVYSIKNNKWATKPTNIDVQIDYESVQRKVSTIVDCIERVEELYEEKKYQKAHDCGKRIKEKIKNMRSSGLQADGIYSIENLAFKMLRRTGYIGILSDIIDNSYDKIHSKTQNFIKNLRIYVSNEEKTPEKGFFKLDEIEKYQKLIKKRHTRMKKRLIGYGKQKNSPPFTKKPNLARSKSAPGGAGGA